MPDVSSSEEARGQLRGRVFLHVIAAASLIMAGTKTRARDGQEPVRALYTTDGALVFPYTQGLLMPRSSTVEYPPYCLRPSGDPENNLRVTAVQEDNEDGSRA